MHYSVSIYFLDGQNDLQDPQYALEQKFQQAFHIHGNVVSADLVGLGQSRPDKPRYTTKIIADEIVSVLQPYNRIYNLEVEKIVEYTHVSCKGD